MFWKKSQSVTLELLHSSLVDAAKSFLDSFRKSHGAESIYSFLFEISEDGYDAHGAIGTEERLTQFASKKIADGTAAYWVDDPDHITLDRVKSVFRWGSTEDAWYQSADKSFASVNKLLIQALKADLFGEEDYSFEKLYIPVLKELSDAGEFGTTNDREQIVLGICHIGGDNSEADFLRWAKLADPVKVFERLRMQLKSAEDEH